MKYAISNPNTFISYLKNSDTHSFNYIKSEIDFFSECELHEDDDQLIHDKLTAPLSNKLKQLLL